MNRILSRVLVFGLLVLSVFVSMGCVVNQNAQTRVLGNSLMGAEKQQVSTIPLSQRVASSVILPNSDVKEFCDIKWIIRLKDGHQIRVKSMNDLAGLVAIRTQDQAQAFFRLNTSSFGSKMSMEDLIGWEVQRNGTLFSMVMSMPASVPGGVVYSDPVIWSERGTWYSQRMLVVPENAQGPAHLIEVVEQTTVDGKYCVLRKTRICDLPGLYFSILRL